MSVFRCEVPACKKPIKLDTEPWTTRRLPATNRVGVVCEPCAAAIDASPVDVADDALARDVDAARQVDRAVRVRGEAARREASPYSPPERS